LKINPRNYLSLDVRRIREKELKEQAEKRRFEMYGEREADTKIQNNEPIDRTKPKAIEGFDNEDQDDNVVTFLPVQDAIDTSEQKQPIEMLEPNEQDNKEPPEPIGRAWTPQEVRRAIAKANKNNRVQYFAA
jgi:hypothetical protein